MTEEVEALINKRKRTVKLIMIAVVASGLVIFLILLHLYFSLGVSELLIPAFFILATLPVDVALVYHLMKSAVRRERELLECVIRLLGRPGIRDYWGGVIFTSRVSGGYLAIKISGNTVEVVRVTGGWAEPTSSFRYKLVPFWGATSAGYLGGCYWKRFEGSWEVRIPTPVGGGAIRISGGSCVAIRARCRRGISCPDLKEFLEMVSGQA